MGSGGWGRQEARRSADAFRDAHAAERARAAGAGQPVDGDRRSSSTRVAPATSRTAAMTAAATGCRTDRLTTPATVTSSPRLTAMLLAGSGEVFKAARMPALTEWLASAVRPPVAPAAIWWSEP